MSDEILDTTTELKPKRRSRGAATVSPLREEEASYPPLADINNEPPAVDDPTYLAEMERVWASDVREPERLGEIIPAAVRSTVSGLHAKLAEVMLIVGRIPKRGVAPRAMGGYPFVQVGDAADVIRVELGKRRVSMLPELVEPVEDGLSGTVFALSDTKSGGRMTTLTIRVTWRLTDADTGETTTIQSLGTGADSGDKFSPKAQTNAMKYAFLMGFLLSTGDDPELADLSDRAGDPVIGDSAVEGVQQGGRQSRTTSVQIDSIRRIASSKQLTADQLVSFLLGDDVDLSDDQMESLDAWDPDLPEADKRTAVMAFIGGLTFAQAGQFIRAIE